MRAVPTLLQKGGDDHGVADAEKTRHHLDYDLQQSQRAGPYYKRAVELEPNNPVFVPFGLTFVEVDGA